MFKIIEANLILDFFKIKGKHVAGFQVGTSIVVRHSKVGNNGTYTITGCSLDLSNNTNIYVTSVPFASTNDGSINLPIVSVISGVGGSFRANGDFVTLSPTNTPISPPIAFKVFGSSGNDGLFHISSMSVLSNQTTFVVTETVPSGVVSGDIVSSNDYIINFSDGITPTILIGEGSINTQLDIDLPGRGTINYGEYLNENLVHILENFQSSIAPTTPSKGQLWYDTSTSPATAKIYNGVSFVLINVGNFVLKSGDTMNLNSNITFNGGEVLGLPNIPTVNNAATSKNYVDTQVGTISTSLSTHSSDNTVHITTLQNTFLDGLNLPTLTATEANYLAGTTSSIQTQLDNKLDKVTITPQSINSTVTFNDNITLGANKDITLQSGGEVLGLPAIPSGVTASASKAYVDSLYASSVTWRNPIVDPDLIDVVTVVPGAPIASTTYIAYGGSYPQLWGATSVNQGDVVRRDNLNSNWIIIDTLSVGDRFIIAGENGTIGATLSGVGFVNDDLIQYGSGNPALFSSWALPEGRGNGGVGTEILQGTTVLVNDPDSGHFGHTYLYDATNNLWVEISGPGSIGSGSGLYYSGNVLNIGTVNTGRIVINANDIDLATTGVVTGTYNTLTVDTYGRVTAGSNAPVTSQWTTVGNDIYYNLGNVGIGTTSPLAVIHTKHSTDHAFFDYFGVGTPILNLKMARGTIGSPAAVVNTDSQNIDFSFYDGTNNHSTSRIKAIVTSTVGLNQIPTALTFHTSTTNTAGLTERMRLTADGKLGLGGIPNEKMEIFNAGTCRLFANDTTNLVITQFGSFVGGGIIGTSTNHAMIIRTNDVERMRIGVNGHVAINTTTNTSRTLNVTAISASNALYLTGVANQNTLVIEANNTVGQSFGTIIFAGTNASDYGLLVRNALNTIDYLRVRGDGNVAIGAIASSAKLHVTGGAGVDPTLLSGTIGLFQNNATTTDISRVVIVGGATGASNIDFGTSASNQVGYIQYDHAGNFARFGTNGIERMRIGSAGHISINIAGTDTTRTLRIDAIPSTAGLYVNGAVNNNAIIIQGNVAVGQSFGMHIYAGTNTSDYGFLVKDANNTVEYFKIRGDGLTMVGPGAMVSGAGVLQVSNGITFPATASLVANANTLDDYEEGTFTPVVQGSTITGTGTYTTQVGLYTKIGRVVTITIDLTLSLHTGTGDMLIVGLPFPCNTASALALGDPSLLEYGASTFISAHMNGGTSTIRMRGTFTNSASGGIPIDPIFELTVSGSYFTNV